jgi:hypothetical protein
MALLTLSLSVLLVGALGFLALAFYYNLAPRALLFKVFSRLGFPLERFRPPVTLSAYHRLKGPETGAHRPVLLNLETSEGSGQVTHPDVAFIPEGFGKKDWTYWMACTPYPFRDARFENPEIFASHDGIHWTVPGPRVNPLVPSPAKAGDHHSDPDILFHGGQLWLFYRQTIRSAIPTENKILLIQSRDGVAWSSPVEVLSDNTAREVLSPAVIHDGRQFLMWTVEICNDEFLIVRRTSPHGLQWSAPQSCALAGLSYPRHAWHIDVLQESDRLSAALVSCIGKGGPQSRIHYAFSTDQGLSWRTDGFWFEQAYEFEAGAQYRGSLLRRAEHPGEYDLWYSAGCSRLQFSIAYLRVRRNLSA